MARVQPHVLRLVLVAVAFVCGLVFFLDPAGITTSTLASSSALAQDYLPGNADAVTHVVLFQFKKGASPASVDVACAKFMALKDTCQSPVTRHPYIRSIAGGRDNSIETLQNGLTHGFVVEFESAAERDYYVNMDPAHQSFKKDIEALVEKVTVVDFTNGRFR
ncbi:stress responsive A/B barrel domain-containing protein [Cercophora scortea]|uniref:Stress responsive A/B barrel domain-containing protein n=1 Tax=Cercophora scortea TaxID=314031 RepID=A0AAE0IZL2_9PEZI|nr:stress responsive A/B barrel domain-containing protein [Cercophora scortea]